MTAPPSIVEFLNARLDEDASDAGIISAGGYAPAIWRFRDAPNPSGLWVELFAMVRGNTEPRGTEVSEGDIVGYIRNGRREIVHITRHDPDRVLRAVEAKRRIVALHKGGDHECSVFDHNGDRDGFHYVLEGDACSTLRLLASEFDTHEDYQETWRP